MGKFIGRESRREITQHWEEGRMRNYCLIGREFLSDDERVLKMNSGDSYIYIFYHNNLHMCVYICES